MSQVYQFRRLNLAIPFISIHAPSLSITGGLLGNTLVLVKAATGYQPFDYDWRSHVDID